MRPGDLRAAAVAVVLLDQMRPAVPVDDAERLPPGRTCARKASYRPAARNAA
jgi:hypothetical protein